MASCHDPDPAGPGIVGASCAVAEGSVVRATCAVELAEPGPVEVELTDGVEGVVFTSAASTDRHEIPVWGLTAGANWDWVVRAAGEQVEGSVHTGALPAEYDLAIEVDPAASGTVEMLFAASSCSTESGRAVVFDAAGRVRWYADLRAEEGRMPVMASQYTEDHTVLAVLDQREWVEVDLLGETVVRVEPGLPVHHDLFRRDGQTWVLLADARPAPDGNTYVEDIVVTYEGAVEVDRWDERDHLVPSEDPPTPNSFWADEFPGAIDAWHTNGVYVTEGGDLLLSSLRAGSLWLVRDREIAWVLGGDADTVPLPSSFTFTGGGDPTFSGQHHPSFGPDGTVLLFDNDAPRGLELSVDEVGQTASLVADWPVAGPCEVQGSVFRTEDDHTVVTCASTQVVREFGPGGDRVATWALGCPSGMSTVPTRVQPVDLWAAQVGSVSARRVR
ncbi:MAG: aryl-sulfate sulfotransferase [Myxococcota bacterium]